MGPVLFIIYANDLPETVKSYCKIFADDTKPYNEISGIKDNDTVKGDILELCKWAVK